MKCGDAADRVEVLTYGYSECTRACAMEYADASGIELQRIVDKVGHGLYSLVGSHSTNVYFGLEGQLSLTARFGGATANYRSPVARTRGGLAQCSGQSRQGNSHFHNAKTYNSFITVDFHNAAGLTLVIK